MMKRGEMVSIPALALDFVEGGNTLWVQGIGGTVLRIKVTGKITTKRCEGQGMPSHADAFLDDDLQICLGSDVGLQVPAKTAEKLFEAMTKKGRR
jgi:photosystem II stability/assembly factor-like uncharacterized protein